MIHLKNLPERPPNFARPGAPDPIGAMIDTIEAAADAARRDRFGAGAGAIRSPEISNDRSSADARSPPNRGGSG